jgi:hypothetical protein
MIRMLGLGGRRGRPLEVNCAVGLSHVQRLEALKMLDGLSGTRGISTRSLAWGPDAPPDQDPDLPPVPAQAWRKIVTESQRFEFSPPGRLRHLLNLRRHQITVAPVGRGELTFRHGEALACGTALVCQDLGHLEMMLPLMDRQNAAFCQHDLSDLRSIVEELLRDDELRTRIARAGRRDWVRWANGWREVLREGIEAHIAESLRLPPQLPS